ncbi:MAG: hypothetical protein R6V17_06345 [Halanaerobacter sp.]
MLCRECIKEIGNKLPDDTAKIFWIIANSEDGMARSDIQSKWEEKFEEKLSYSVFHRMVSELETTLLIRHKKFSQTKVYGLTKNGNKLKNIIEGDGE